MRLAEHVAVVTGAGRGIGAAVALRFAAEGAAVLVNDVQQEAADQVAQQIIAAGGRALAVAADVGDFEQVRGMVRQARDAWGRFDVIVNNAGINRDTTILKMTAEQWEQVLRVNLTGCFNGCKAAAEALAEQGRGGRIVNMASRAYLGNYGQTNYSASKAGVVGMTRTLAMELARYDVTVNAIAPGFIDTEMTRGVPDDVREKVVRAIPLRRMGRPEEVASLALFLASPEASYITGQVLFVCGGRSLGAAPA